MKCECMPQHMDEGGTAASEVQLVSTGIDELDRKVSRLVLFAATAAIAQP